MSMPPFCLYDLYVKFPFFLYIFHFMIRNKDLSRIPPLLLKRCIIFNMVSGKQRGLLIRLKCWIFPRGGK